MINIFFKELNSFLSSLIAYVVIAVFLLAIGLFTWVFPETNVIDYGYADMSTLFNMGPFIFMFLIPAITMKMFSEEYKTGTIETLLSRPISTIEIVLGKFISGVLLVIFAIIPTIVFYFSISYLANPVGNIDTAGIIGSYVGLILLGMVFTAIGIFSSSLTDNQVVAFILGTFLCFILFAGLGSMATINVWSSLSLALTYIGLESHYISLGKGLLDSRDIIYLLASSGLFIYFTTLIVDRRR